jgi:hypothetical protein
MRKTSFATELINGFERHSFRGKAKSRRGICARWIAFGPAGKLGMPLSPFQNLNGGIRENSEISLTSHDFSYGFETRSYAKPIFWQGHPWAQ